MYNIVPHNIRNEAIMLQDFHINSPYGRLDKHPPQGRWEGYVEKFQYNQELGGQQPPQGRCQMLEVLAFRMSKRS